MLLLRCAAATADGVAVPAVDVVVAVVAQVAEGRVPGAWCRVDVVTRVGRVAPWYAAWKGDESDGVVASMTFTSTSHSLAPQP